MSGEVGMVKSAVLVRVIGRYIAGGDHQYDKDSKYRRRLGLTDQKRRRHEKNEKEQNFQF